MIGIDFNAINDKAIKEIIPIYMGAKSNSNSIKIIAKSIPYSIC